MIQRFGNIATGFSFRLSRKLSLEFWYVFPNKKVPWHFHTKFTSNIIHIFGMGVVGIEQKTKVLKCFSWFWSHLVDENVWHSVVAGKYGFLFLNIERWQCNPSSACIDYHGQWN